MNEYGFQQMDLEGNLTNKTIYKSIGIIIKNLKYQFYTTIAEGAKQYANDRGYSVLLLDIDDSFNDIKKLLQIINSKKIKGLIISQVSNGTSEIEYLFKMKMTNFPFVLLEDFKGIQANIITIDNEKAINGAVKYLMDTGHTKIVYFAGPPRSVHNLERITGFRYAFSESTMMFDEKMIVPIGVNFNDSYEKTIKYFRKIRRKDYPTAIVCFNDHQALAVMNALMRLNLRVPDDISLIGFNDIYDVKIYPIPLTTIRVPLNEMGKKAAEILIRNIESDEIFPEEKVVFEPEFILRESTKVLNEKPVSFSNEETVNP